MVIQRSWKILSEAGSTSASASEAIRSPAALHSSSDDSNCSNPTAHSMVTSVASPTANKTLESVALNSAKVLPNNADVSMKFVTTPQMAETMLQRLRQRLGGAITTGNNGHNAESAMRSLELLRISVQQAFDKEVDAIVKKFMENYFKPAFGNIKENLGQHAVCEEMLQKMSCALLENAKAQYPQMRVRNQLTLQPTGNLEEQALRMAIKRPAAKPVFELKNKLYVAATAQLQPSAPAQTASAAAVAVAQPVVGLQPKLNSAGASNSAQRRQIFWNTAHISTSTKFVLDVQANIAFGYGSDGKERLASKHPELIRYLPDLGDRDWLAAQNIIPQQNRNSRFLFLIHDEVCRLQQTHDLYRSKTTVDLNIMLTFTVPDFMIQKMKLFFVDLNIKSRGLITNSFSIGNSMQCNSHLRNALLQGVQQVAAAAATNAAQATAVASGLDVSIGNAVAITAAGTSTQNFVECVSNNTNNGINNNNSNNNNNNNANLTTAANNVGGSSAINVLTNLKPKVLTSALSSSHATLTALLNNSSGGNGAGGTTTAAAADKNKLC